MGIQRSTPRGAERMPDGRFRMHMMTPTEARQSFAPLLPNEALDIRMGIRPKPPTPPLSDAELDARMGIPPRAARSLHRTPVRVQAMTPTFARLLAGGPED
ncbi:hypothetical protein [Sorangium sp. So ce128]|uniref:hypothetical protein n=1 Tax=Sorangium sp. So ce128 TaxID=3133281 RepID=UPI003F614F47